MTVSSKSYLVIGATGKTGRRVYNKLKALGLNVKGASRNGEVHFNWQSPETWSTSLIGVDSLYLTYYPDLAIPQAPDDIAKMTSTVVRSTR